MATGPSAAAEQGSPEYVLIDDFQSYEIGRFPAGWDWRSEDDASDKPYTVAAQDSNQYLAARDQGQSVIIGKKIRIDIDRYPYISFKWRVHRIPENGDERHGETGDSAAAIYIVYQRVMGLIPVTVKYVWSTTLPVGTALQRSGIGRPWIIVADSGETGVGEWRRHVFDLRAAYRETFGKKPRRQIIAVGILSDANATGSEAYADYDDLYFLSEADAGSGIQQIVEAD